MDEGEARETTRRMPRRWWLFRLFDAFVEWAPGPAERKGVLIVRIDGIGDMVMFQAAWRATLRLWQGQGPVTLLGCRSWAPLAAQLFPGADFIAIDEHRFDRDPFYRYRVSRDLKRRGFAVAVCDSYLRKPLVADSLIHATEAPLRIVARPHITPKTEMMFAWSLSQCSQIIDTGVYPTHEIVRHFRFVSALAGRNLAPAPPALPWPKPARGDYAVVNIGGNEPGRRWPAESFLALARDLAERGVRVVVVGGAQDRVLKPKMAELATVGLVEDRIGATTVTELADLLAGAALVVSSDTGPAHLALGLGAPTIVLLGGGHFGSFVPYPEGLAPANARFLWVTMPCYHCFWTCIQPHQPGSSFPCVAAIPAAEVRSHALDLLGLTG